MTLSYTAYRLAERYAVPLLMVLLIVSIALTVLTGSVEIINKTLAPGNNAGDLKPVLDVVNNIKGPANVVAGSAVGLGTAVGGGMLALGQQAGIRILATSGLAGVGTLTANGVSA
jgi:hypothetical protein